MRACRNCRMMIESEKICPKCQGTDLTEKYSGEVIMLDPEKSEISKVVEINAPGKYALRVK